MSHNVNTYTLHKTIKTTHGHTTHLTHQFKTTITLQPNMIISWRNHLIKEKITTINLQLDDNNHEQHIKLQDTSYGLTYNDYAESEITDEILEKDQQEAFNHYNDTIHHYQKQGWTITYTGHTPQ